MDLGSPRASLAALLELNKLLIQRRFRRGSPDGFIIGETQNENLAATDTISRDRSPAQHALDSHKLVGLSAAQRTIVIARLANVLMAAAGIVTEESRDDEP
ncbi:MULTISPECIES: hypothetical protein [Mesorhizobium]|uniref:hypothetical protein n=1 Tax=Mesorhizobium TaxID=68287 RepID=UPI0007A9583C|nr:MULTISPECIES: hypothetical protein [Mesorhizobium]WIE92722.1 hypothetical protein P9270_006000 [Mesorhizobium sp. WSM4875]AMX95445.1 hypothetical protein A4R28_21640 [Mesorhizobium ciceri]MBE1711615.1 hypothetical protein [Mesorhizobium japonicum]MBE1717839.1 hypothetical protein [Mesorhizobium japonicum]MBZ9798543.1 hypothetical protein [Mesorhizobium sp. ES1-4]